MEENLACGIGGTLLMASTKVLMLYSWDDDFSQNRWRLLSDSPLIWGFDLHQCFALANEKEVTNATRLAGRLRKSIAQCRPHVLLVHTGGAFHRQPEAFIAALSEVRLEFSSLRFGIESIPGPRFLDQPLSIPPGLFDDSYEMHEFEDLLFRRVFGKTGGGR